MRCSTEEARDIVERLLADRVVRDVEAPAYYSVQLGTGSRRRAAPMHFLYDGPSPAFGTRDLRRLFSGLVMHLAAHVRRDDHLLRLSVGAVATPRGMLLVPHQATGMAKQAERILLKRGVAFMDVPDVSIDPTTREVVLDEPPFPLDWSAIPPATAVAEPNVEPGRHPLAGWLMTVDEDAVGALSPALGTLYATRLIIPPKAADAQWALDSAVALVRALEPIGIFWGTPEELMERIAAGAI